ncbi:polyamine aminopropyltransferase [Armatimonadetes bacterium]|nr:polyamine aminopropyltransferase [bacterium]
MELWYTEEWSEFTRFSIKIDEQLHSEQSEFQRIDILRSEEYGKFFTLDGLMMVTEKDEFIYHDMIVHPAMAVNPEIKNVLVIGAGDGGTVRELTRYKSIEKIDMVEIDGRVVDLCKEHFPGTSSKLEDPRVNVVIQDGLKWVLEADRNYYDLIIVDSTDPIGPGEGLFSTEFYQNCYNILTDNGILINQNESPYFDRYAKEMRRAQDKIRNVFPIALAYQAHIPTYPSGHWLFGFASKKLHPLVDANHELWLENGLKTKYYNPQLHFGAFALPNYVKELLGDV